MNKNDSRINYIKCWLSEMARFYKHRAIYKMFPEMFKPDKYDGFKTIDFNSGVHLENAKAVADEIGITVTHSKIGNSNSVYPHRYSFKYEGVIFHSIHENEL